MTKGQSLIEILIVMALMAMLLPVLLGALITSREGRPQQIRRAVAAQKLQETKEALRSVREAGWNNIQTNGIYHLTNDGTSWALSPNAETQDGMTTQIVISDVERNASHTIVSSGGVIDPSTKKISVTISWLTPMPTSISSTMYLTRYLDNATYIQTTEEDFDTGTHTNTTVTNEDGGEVTLGLGGGGNWCGPELTISALDLPKNGAANALTAIEGRAFAGTGDNASGVSYADITITNSNPPTASINTTIDGYKTNDVFGELGYGYLTTDTNSEEVVIIDTNSGTKVGYFNASGSTDGESIFVVGNVGYMTQGNNFRTFDLSSKSGSRPQLGSVSLAGLGKALHVVGNYAYVAISGNSGREMEIVNISNPSSLSIVGYANPNSQSGEDIIVNETGTRAYLATRNSSSQDEVFVFDVTSKTGLRPIISSFNTNGMDPRGITLVPGNKLITVGIGGEEYQVINISNESSPVRCGGLDVSAGINDVASVLESDGDAFSYILTRDSSEEFRIIAGGPGGQYSSSGTYESATFDLGYGTAFNRFIPTYIAPPNTALQFQISIADPISGSCNGITHHFTGPDGTDSSYYTTIEPIVFDNDGADYENPGRCFRYRAYFASSDSSSTPLLEEVIVNYSP